MKITKSFFLKFLITMALFSLVTVVEWFIVSDIQPFIIGNIVGGLVVSFYLYRAKNKSNT